GRMASAHGRAAAQRAVHHHAVGCGGGGGGDRRAPARLGRGREPSGTARAVRGGEALSRLAANLALAAFGLIGALLVLELALRLAGFSAENTMADPNIGYRMVPHGRYHWIAEGGSRGRFNGAG